MNGICAVPGCDGRARRRGWCANHYARWYTTGSTDLASATRTSRLASGNHAEQCGGGPIPGHEGFFATRDGRIFTALHGTSLRRAPLELAQHLDKGGYPRVRIKGKRYGVHQLVALTFLGPCPQGQEVRHLNGIRGDARADNLAYGTGRENSRDRITHGTMPYGEKSPNARWTDAQVAEAVALYRAGGFTQREVGEFYGARQQAVSGWLKAARLQTPDRYGRSVA